MGPQSGVFFSLLKKNSSLIPTPNALGCREGFNPDCTPKPLSDNTPPMRASPFMPVLSKTGKRHPWLSAAAMLYSLNDLTDLNRMNLLPAVPRILKGKAHGGKRGCQGIQTAVIPPQATSVGTQQSIRSRKRQHTRTCRLWSNVKRHPATKAKAIISKKA